MTTQNWQDPAAPGTENLAIQNSQTATGYAPTTQSATTAAKDEAKNVAKEGASAGKQVAGTAVEETKAVAQEAGNQAKNLVSELGSNLKDQAGAQQQRVAEGLRSLSEELRSMSRAAENSGAAANLVDQAAQRTGDVAGWFEARDPGSLLQEVKGFARNRPGAFLAVAAGAGLLAGRLTRGITGTQSDSQSSLRAAAPAPTPRTTPAPPAAEPTAGNSGTAAPVTGDPFSDPWDAEPTLPAGIPPVSTDPGRRHAL
jgi:hypothetical protein